MAPNNNWIKTSLNRQKSIFKDSLILNPTENIQINKTVTTDFQFLSGLYITDQDRGMMKPNRLKVSFAGRSRASYDNRRINNEWSTALKGQGASLRMLSGLHAHIALFMSIANIDDSVLLLPEEGGGHFSVSKILKRLGLKVIRLPLDNKEHAIDVDSAINLIENEKIDFLFIDRSEGIVYEDHSRLVASCNKYGIYSIFDASQYLSNIICGDFINPFEMGFNLIVATTHKNFPGPQKAIVVTDSLDRQWESIERDFSVYISNSHPLAIYQAGEAIFNLSKLRIYSNRMLETQKSLILALDALGIQVIKPSDEKQNTHHIWITNSNFMEAFEQYKTLEKLRINTNYRLLPYDLGHGIRLGTSAAVLQGLTTNYTDELAAFIRRAFSDGFNLKLKHEIRQFVQKMAINNDFSK